MHVFTASTIGPCNAQRARGADDIIALNQFNQIALIGFYSIHSNHLVGQHLHRRSGEVSSKLVGRILGNKYPYDLFLNQVDSLHRQEATMQQEMQDFREQRQTLG
jgi:hypothetical protein